jgi:hypothetical protein
MATHNIFEVRKTNWSDDRVIRPVRHASVDLDNGNVVRMNGQLTTAGMTEVWDVVAPTTQNLTDLWFIAEPEYPAIVSGSGMTLRGEDEDVRQWYLPATKVGTARKAVVGDIVVLTADGLAGDKSTNTFVVASNTVLKLTWAAAAISGLSLKLLEEVSINIPQGTIGLNRITGYKFEVVAN